MLTTIKVNLKKILAHITNKIHHTRLCEEFCRRDVREGVGFGVGFGSKRRERMVG